MKIALVEPAAPDYHIYSAWAIPRLGLPVLGSILKERGHQVRIYHEDLEGFSARKIWEILKADLVGISITSSTAPRGYAMGRLLKLKEIPVVFGGVHATFLPEEPLKFGDYVLQGEAEESFPKLVSVLENGGDLSEVPNLFYKDGDRVVATEKRPMSLSLDEMPLPDFSLIEGYEKLRIYPVMTSRGCPFNCTFCCVTAMFGRRYRMASIERVLEEVARLKNRHIFFCDDNFAVSADRSKHLLSEMLRRNVLPRRWNTQIRADAYRDRELLKLMKQTHCSRVFVGFESINEEVLKEYHKRQSVEDIKRCISTFHEYGIAVHGMFMFGAESDNIDSFRRTIGFCEEHKLDTAQFLILTPVPGSELFKKMDEEGRIFTYDWRLYDGHHVVFKPARMSPLELQLESLKANRRFYSTRSALRCLSGLRITTALSRHMGKRIVNKWYQKNATFLGMLRDWQKGQVRFPRHFTLAPQAIGTLPPVS